MRRHPTRRSPRRSWRTSGSPFPVTRATTAGFGGSASYALTPALSVGGGAAYVGATDAAGPYGDFVIEIDGGATYRFNPNLVFNLFGGVLFPDSGDTAWAVTFRTQYSF